MNSLTSKTLEFSNTRIRTAGTFERPLFCLKDICDSIGIKNPSAYTPHLKPHWKDDLISNDAIGRSQKFTFITEEGVYRVLVRTRKPAAEKFQDWLCEEVLPSIRKTGQYQCRQPIAQRICIRFMRSAAGLPRDLRWPGWIWAGTPRAVISSPHTGVIFGGHSGIS